MSAPILEAKNICLSFAAVRALNDVSLSVNEGEIFAVIGPNGAGKSSLFNVITRFYQPTSGSLELRGSDLLARGRASLADAGVARSFQNLGVFARLSVRDNVLLGRHHATRPGLLGNGFGLRGHRRHEREDGDAVAAVIETLDLADVADRAVGELPYGLQKRVDFGRCLAADPELLLLDEPVAGMSTHERTEIVEVIERIHADRQLSIVIVEHDMGVVMRLADRVLAMDFGVPLATGTPDHIQSHPDVIRSYLGDTKEIAS